jgi:hypothetical protein
MSRSSGSRKCSSNSSSNNSNINSSRKINYSRVKCSNVIIKITIIDRNRNRKCFSGSS